MTREEILNILLRWNPWGKVEKRKTIDRDQLKKIKILKDYRGVIVIKGPRRSGKSTLLYQLIEDFSKQRDSRSILYVNFEDYSFSAENLGAEALETIVEVYRQEIYQDNDFLLFLDEIQNVEGWSNWVRTAIDADIVKTIFVTGSSSKILSGELASLLTGRHVDFELLPFSFREYLKARRYSPKDRIELMSKKNMYLNILKDYIIFGGFPEVVLNIDNEFLINKILSQYAEDMILKDVVARYNIVNLKLLKSIAKYLAQNIGNRVTIRKIQRNFEDTFEKKSSTTTISNYISYLEMAYIFFEVHNFDYSIKKTVKSPLKYYIVDPGLRNAMFPSFTPDRGRLLENAVYLKLRNIYEEVFYWMGKNEIDFVCKKGDKFDLYNVSYVSRHEEIDQRELKGLVEFPYDHVDRRYLITWDLSGQLSYDGVNITSIPAYIFLAEEKERV